MKSLLTGLAVIFLAVAYVAALITIIAFAITLYVICLPGFVYREYIRLTKSC